MAKQQIILLPKTQLLLKDLGEKLRLARLRRNITARLDEPNRNSCRTHSVINH